MILESSINIDRPAEDVWNFMNDHDSMHLWLKGYQSSKILQGQPASEGAVIEHTYKERNRPFVIKETVLKSMPPKNIRLILSHPTMEFMVITNLISIAPASTMIEMKSEIIFKVISFKILAPLMKRSFQKRQDSDLSRLKMAME